MDHEEEISGIFSRKLQIKEDELGDDFDSFTVKSKALSSPSSLYKTICPAPGYCLKCHTVDNDKVFVNICISDSIPPPLDLTDEELQKLIEDAPEQYRVPLSLGEPHSDLDKSGTSCAAYDAVIHPKFYEKIEASDVFRAFFYYAVFQGLEQKYAVQIDDAKQYVRLQNRKYFGSLQQQNIRTYAKPMIMESRNLSDENNRSEESPQPVITKPWYRIENVKMALVPEQLPAGYSQAGGDAATVIGTNDVRRLLLTVVELPFVSSDFDCICVQILPNTIMISHEPSQRRWMTYHPWQPSMFCKRKGGEKDATALEKPTAEFDCEAKVLKVYVPVAPVNITEFKCKLLAPLQAAAPQR